MLGLVVPLKDTKEKPIAVNMLTYARKLIEKGWIKGKLKSGWFPWTKKYCVQGAIFEASLAYKRHVMDKDSFYCQDVFIKANRIAFGSIHAWNDGESRTKEEVLKGFDRAIAYAEMNECTRKS